MKLGDRNWAPFYIRELFNIKLSQGDNQAKLLLDGTYPLVSAGNSQNGICKYIKQGDVKSQLFNKNLLTIDMFGKVFFQPAKFYAVSHGRINILIPKFKINKYIALFIISVLEKKTLNRYSFSHMCNKRRLYNETIYLPITNNLRPDYEFMEAYMREKETQVKNHYKKFVTSRLQDKHTKPQEPKEWKEFEIEEIFKLYTGTDLILNDVKKGNIPIISHTAVNNGVAQYSNIIPRRKIFDNTTTISLADRGNFKAFVQLNNFYIGTRVKALEIKEKINSKYTLMFLSKIIDKQAVKFSYGNNACNRLKNLKIILPINDFKQPDYVYMENYMKYLEQKKLKAYLDYLNK